MIDNSDAYVAVCEKANLPINKMPKSKKDLTLAYEMALKEFNPHLYQNATRMVLSYFASKIHIQHRKTYHKNLTLYQ